jgi:hypothetical protein
MIHHLHARHCGLEQLDRQRIRSHVSQVVDSLFRNTQMVIECTRYPSTTRPHCDLVTGLSFSISVEGNGWRLRHYTVRLIHYSWNFV